LLARWKSRPAGTGPGELNPLVRATLASTAVDSRESVARAYGKLLRQVYDESKAAGGGVGTASPPIEEPARKQLLDALISPDSPAYFPTSDTRRYMSRQPKDQFSKMLVEIDRLAVKSPHAPPRAMVLYDSPTLHSPRIFVRGNPGQAGPAVSRQFLAILSPDQRSAFPHGSGRLDLAKAIASPDNPLTSRVIVNRVWMHHFGEPLVATPSDFGLRSAPPSHPELLDHLATRFVREDWSLKRLHRLIMLSSTYRQSSNQGQRSEVRSRKAEVGSRISDLRSQISNPRSLNPLPSTLNPQPSRNPQAVDPENRLLWRANRRRLDFEAMRDTLLAVSGRLSQRLAGRPADIAGDPQCADRSVYALVDRQGLPGLFRTFDFAAPDQSVERRPRTMVPQQALFALNSPFMLVAARALSARQEIAGAAEPAAGVTALYRTALAREPTPAELKWCLEFVAVPADRGSSLTTWEQLAQLLMASNEAMYLD
jgi:hypothetical protein